MIPKKWEPVFGKRSCSNKEPERDDDSKKSHPALVRSFPRDALQGRARAFLHRSLVGLIVRLVDHDRLQHELLRHRLLAQAAQRDLDAEATLREAVGVAAAEDIARFDEIEGLPAGIDADHQRGPVGGL